MHCFKSVLNFAKKHSHESVLCGVKTIQKDLKAGASVSPRDFVAAFHGSEHVHTCSSEASASDAAHAPVTDRSKAGLCVQSQFLQWALSLQVYARYHPAISALSLLPCIAQPDKPNHPVASNLSYHFLHVL